MASLSKETTRSGKVGWRIVWTDSEGKQKALRLGQIPRRAAERMLILTERLLEARRLGLPLDPETTRWVEDLDDTIAERLARLGLIPPRKMLTLAEFLQDWIHTMTHCKSATKIARGLTVKDLMGFFGPSKPIREITREEAEAFHQHLADRGLRPATVAKRIEHAKMAFRRGVTIGLLEKNPFEHVKCKTPNLSERRQYVPAETVEKLLPHCPNWVWRLLLVLARFAGLRTPSEPFSLKWEDVLWAEGKLLINSPKTGLRAVPLFPRVRKALEEAWELAEPGSDYIFPEEYRRRAMGPAGFQNANLRTTLLKIIRRAGEKPWPRLWHNLRASCETDLVKRYPLPVVAKWLGNSSMIAYRHYVDPTDQHFQAAAQEDVWASVRGGEMNDWTQESGVKKSIKANVSSGLQAVESCSPAPENFPEILDLACRKSLLHKDLMAGTGFEPVTSRL